MNQWVICFPIHCKSYKYLYYSLKVGSTSTTWILAIVSGNMEIRTKEISDQKYLRLIRVSSWTRLYQQHDNLYQHAVILSSFSEKCWFCLSSPDVEKHLIITIGEHFYLALAKGPINKYHVMILSTKHVPCAAQLSSEDWEELDKFKTALKKFFKSLGQVVCFTERHYKSVHLQINALAFEEGYAWKIKHSFEVTRHNSPNRRYVF